MVSILWLLLAPMREWTFHYEFCPEEVMSVLHFGEKDLTSGREAERTKRPVRGHCHCYYNTRHILAIYVKLWDKWEQLSTSIIQIPSLQKNGLQAWYSSSGLIPSRNLSKPVLFIRHYFFTWEGNFAAAHT